MKMQGARSGYSNILIFIILTGHPFPTVQHTVPFTDSITEQNANMRLTQIAIIREHHDSPTTQSIYSTCNSQCTLPTQQPMLPSLGLPRHVLKQQ